MPPASALVATHQLLANVKNSISLPAPDRPWARDYKPAVNKEEEEGREEVVEVAGRIVQNLKGLQIALTVTNTGKGTCPGPPLKRGLTAVPSHPYPYLDLL